MASVTHFLKLYSYLLLFEARTESYGNLSLLCFYILGLCLPLKFIPVSTPKKGSESIQLRMVIAVFWHFCPSTLVWPVRTALFSVRNNPRKRSENVFIRPSSENLWLSIANLFGVRHIPAVISPWLSSSCSHSISPLCLILIFRLILCLIPQTMDFWNFRKLFYFISESNGQ